jgi:hypothetical protein
MPDKRVRNLKDPYPTTLEGVHEELRYWATRQSEGDPGSPHEEGVKGRLESLRDLERQFKDQQNRTQSTGDLIFISCGQFTKAERALGREVSKLVDDLTPYDAYFADTQASLAALTENILSKLNQCAGLIAIMHPRGEVVFQDGSRHIRGSVWIEQEIGIAAFITQVLKKPMNVAAFIHQTIKREGMRDQLHLNPVFFEQDRDVLDSLRATLPTWSSAVKERSPIKLDISHEKKRITGERHDYELKVTVVNTGPGRIEKWELDVTFPNVFLEQSRSYAVEVPEQRTDTHRFFRMTEEMKRQSLYPNSRLLGMTIPYFVDKEIYYSESDYLALEVTATFYASDLEPVSARKKMSELQIF